MGWFLDYVCRLVKTYPSLDFQNVVWELDMAQGWAYYSWAVENDPWLQFSGLKRNGGGYVADEAKRLLKGNG